MKAEETIQKMYNKYPDLFAHRKDVLDHLFCVIGNGYSWVNGELVDFEQSTHAPKLRGGDKAKQTKKFYLSDVTDFIQRFLDAKISLDTLDMTIVSKTIRGKTKYFQKVSLLPENSYFSYAEAYAIQKGHSYTKSEDGSYITLDKFDWYPLSKTYSKLFNLPVDIKPDWLALVNETKTLLAEDGVDIEGAKL